MKTNNTRQKNSRVEKSIKGGSLEPSTRMNETANEVSVDNTSTTYSAETELEIAKELWKEENNSRGKFPIRVKALDNKMQQHLQTCKRWIEWLRHFNIEDDITPEDYDTCQEIGDKISDLQETIKFYEVRGIK